MTERVSEKIDFPREGLQSLIVEQEAFKGSTFPKIFWEIQALEIPLFDPNSRFLKGIKDITEWLITGLRTIVDEHILLKLKNKHPHLTDEQILASPEYTRESEELGILDRNSAIQIAKWLFKHLNDYLIELGGPGWMRSRSIQLEEENVLITDLYQRLHQGMFKLITEIILPDITDEEIKYIWTTPYTLEQLRRILSGEEIPKSEIPPENLEDTVHDVPAVTISDPLARPVQDLRTSHAELQAANDAPEDSFPPTGTN
ncbi:hypothetical protein HOG48_05280 [Candidatus Peregrinibacteria bacterium]|jgi:hypothetical protein|nr:hypothetical protein [Candidatus Peregrinibacteria bacterium]